MSRKPSSVVLAMSDITKFIRARTCASKSRTLSSSDFSISSLHRLSGDADGRSRPGFDQGKSRAGRGVLTGHPNQMMIGRILARLAWLDDHWIGDLIGVVCLFGGLWLGLMIAEVLQ